MNSVDIMDQRRSTNPTRGNEKRLSMTLFTLILDLAVHNAFSLYLWLLETGNIKETKLTYREFKRRIVVDLVTPYLNQTNVRQKKQKHSENASSLDARQSNMIDEDLSEHFLLPTLDKKQIQCFLCKTLDNSKQRKDSYCCSKCEVGFHPECFTAFHHKKALAEHRKVLHQVISTSLDDKRHRRKKQKYISDIYDLQLPCF